MALFEGVCVNYRHPAPRRGEPRVCAAGRVAFPLDPVENSWKLKKEQQSYGLGTFGRKMGTQFELGPEKMCQRGRELKITKSDQKWSRNGSPSIRFAHPRSYDRLRSGPELVG